MVWGVKGEQQWRAEAQRKSLPLWRMEDGFLRSSGLGSDLLPPLSLVLDKRGIYYDATRPSDLEVLLNHSQLTLAQKMRAEKLRQRVKLQMCDVEYLFEIEMNLMKTLLLYINIYP